MPQRCPSQPDSYPIGAGLRPSPRMAFDAAPRRRGARDEADGTEVDFRKFLADILTESQMTEADRHFDKMAGRDPDDEAAQAEDHRLRMGRDSAALRSRVHSATGSASPYRDMSFDQMFPMAAHIKNLG